MYSMTGYGRADYNENGLNLVVEIKTVNNRNLDLNCKMPRMFLSLEDGKRKLVQSYIQRGRVDLFINFSDMREQAANVEVDLAKAQAYYNASKTIADALSLTNDISVSQLMKSPDVIVDAISSDATEFKDIVINTVAEALKNLNSMRLVEGEKLVKDLLSRVEVIENLAGKIKERAPLVAKEYKEKLKTRIEEFLLDVKYDEARLLNEVAFYTDRVNIDEELTRLKSHIGQFRKIVDASESGKKLDFLMQEFNRETNTICSKSNDIEVTNYALALKNEIEKVREQVQNLE